MRVWDAKRRRAKSEQTDVVQEYDSDDAALDSELGDIGGGLEDQLAQMGLAGDGDVSPKSGTAEPSREPRDARDYFKEVDATAPSSSQAVAQSWTADEWSEVDNGSGARSLALTKPAPPVPVANPFTVLDDAERTDKSE